LVELGKKLAKKTVNFTQNFTQSSINCHSAEKCLNVEHVITVVALAVNFIQSHEINQCQFQSFLSEIDGDGVLYNTEVQWLSCGIVVNYVFSSEVRNKNVHE
jgi:hypothetical protein